MIYDLYSPGLYRYAYRLLGDENLAEDCVGETFSRFLKALQAHQGPDHYLKAYLYRVAHNWITDQYRRHAPVTVDLDDEAPDGDESQPENRAAASIEQQEVRMALRCLTAEQRQVIVLRYIEGWDNKEVAQALNKPIGAIKALQHRALQSIRKLVAE